MADNETEQEFLLNRQAEATFSDTEKTDAVARWQEATDSGWAGATGQEVLDANRRYVKHSGADHGKFLATDPREYMGMEIGTGEGQRKIITSEDAAMGRMFLLDQGMGDQDEAYSPTTDSTDAMRWSSAWMNHAIAQVESLDPELASQLAYGERFMALFPEVAVVTRNGFGFAGITEDIMAEITGVDVADIAGAAQSYTANTDTLDQFLQDYGNKLDPATKQILYLSLAPLSVKEQTHLAALSAAYIDNRPLVTNEDQIEFANYVNSFSQNTYAKESDTSLWGKIGRTLGKVFTEPANYIQDQILGSVWNAAVDPADAWYRNDLTLEETMAISFGQDPGTQGWETFNGLAGAGIDIVIDPTNIAFAAVSGYKLAKTASMIDEFASLSGKSTLIAKQFLPWGGKKAAIAAGLPKGLRGRSARIAWSFFGKTQDALVDVAREKGVMKAIAEASSYSAVIEKFPQLAKAPAGLVEYMVAHTDPEDVERIYRAAFKGEFLDPSSTAHVALRASAEEAKTAVKDTILAQGDNLTAGDIINVNGGGAVHAVPVHDPALGPQQLLGYADDEWKKINDIADAADAKAVQANDVVKESNSGLVDQIKGDYQAALDASEGRGVEAFNDFVVNPVESLGTVTDSAGNAYEVRRIIGTATDGSEAFVNYGVFRGEELVGGILGAPGKTLTNTAGIMHGLDDDVLQAGKGVMTQVWDLARKNGDDFLLQSGQSESLTSSGFSFAKRYAQHVRDTFGEGIVAGAALAADPYNVDGYATFLDASVKIGKASPGTSLHAEIIEWVKNNKFIRNGFNADGTIRESALKAYMEANGLGALEMNGNLILHNAENLRDAGMLRTFKGGEAANAAVADAAQNAQRLRIAERANLAKADEAGKWIVSDMPMKVPTTLDDLKFWNKKFGVFKGSIKETSWLARRLRGTVAKMFIDDIPQQIELGLVGRTNGANDLRRLLVQMGVDPQLVRQSVDEFIANPTREVVMNAIQRGAMDIGDHEIAMGLMRFYDKTGTQLEYAVIDGKNITNGVSAEGVTRLQPLMPTQTSDFLQLPDSRALSAHFRRVKRGNNRTFNVLNRGFGKTAKARSELLSGFRRRLVASPEALAQFDALDDNDKLAMAYAVVRPKDSGLADGLGYAAKMGQFSAEQWRRLRNTFSVAMLAWRPIGWMGNEMLDNTWRATMAGTLSFFRHPFQSMQTALDAKRIEAGAQATAAYLAQTNDVIAGIRTVAKSADDVLNEAARVVPDIRKYVETVDDTEAQIEAVRKFLNTEVLTNTEAITILDEPLAKMALRQRKGAAAAKKYRLPIDAETNIYDPDWEGVSVTGWEQQYAETMTTSSMRYEWVDGVADPEVLRGYAIAWGNNMRRTARDPMVKAWLEQYARGMAGTPDNGYAASRVLNTAAHERMRVPIDNMLRADGFSPDDMTDLEKLTWYFNNKIDPYVRDQFGPLLNASNARSLPFGKATLEANGSVVALDLDDKQSMLDVVVAANAGGVQGMPKSVLGVMNPRMIWGYDTGAKGWKTPLKSYNQWAFQKFGHDIPINLQRRPAFLKSYERYKNKYLTMGFTDEAADIVAKQKATQLINTSFFFLEAQTPFLKSMNAIFPFFAAQWEVVKAWTWKVPTLSNYGGVGHARMLRSFDHIFNTLRRNGLLSANYDENGKVSGWNLHLAQTPETKNAVGAAISKAGWLTLAAPSIFVEQIAEIASGMDLDLSPHEFNFNFNHPYDFFGKGGGILPTARMQMGLNPAMSYPASKITEMLPFTTSSKDITSEAGTLKEYMDTNEVGDYRDFLTLNKRRLIESGAIDAVQYEELRQGIIGPSDIDIPAGLDFTVPQTNFIGSIKDNVLFPYGQTQSIEESISGFVPSTVKSVFSAFALFANNGEVDGATSWMIPPILGPRGTYGIGSMYVDAAAELEMRTGIIGDRQEIAEKLSKLEAGTPEANKLELELHQMDDVITQEIRDAATSRAVIQSIYNIFVPAHPRIPTESEELRNYYYDARTAADQYNEGKPVAMPFDGKGAYETWQQVAAWAGDPSGSAAKLEFLRQGGGRTSILAAISPQTYWGPGGEPPATRNLQEYMDQVESGERLPLPLDVWAQRYQRLVISTEKEMAIVDAYGNDPWQQALGIVNDRAGYLDITEEFDNKYRALDIEDELLHNNAYENWVNTNADTEYIDFEMEETNDSIAAIEEVLGVIEMDMYPEDPNEAIAISGQLKGLRSELYAVTEQYNDDKYAGYEPSPRQQILNDFYQKLGDYYDELGTLYEGVDKAKSKAERDAIYDQIAAFRDDRGRQMITLGGHQLTSPEEYSWSSKSLDSRKVLTEGKIGGKMTWWTELDMEHIADTYPESADYMATSPTAKKLFDWYREQEDKIAAMFAADGPHANDSATKTKKALEEQFRTYLRDAGEFKVLEALDATPLDRAHMFGMLPKNLEFIVPVNVALQRQLQANEKSILSRDGTSAKLYMLRYVQDAFARDPQAEAEFVRWGQRTFGETTIDTIVAKMMGDYGGTIN